MCVGSGILLESREITNLWTPLFQHSTRRLGQRVWGFYNLYSAVVLPSARFSFSMDSHGGRLCGRGAVVPIVTSSIDRAKHDVDAGCLTKDAYGLRLLLAHGFRLWLQHPREGQPSFHGCSSRRGSNDNFLSLRPRKCTHTNGCSLWLIQSPFLRPSRVPQDTTFNQNLSYTILSWPEDHVQDLLELWRLQVLFFATIIFNILLSALLIFTDNPDRCACVYARARVLERAAK